jgi:predicted patatin/cPLA2 family phospholipase
MKKVSEGSLKIENYIGSIFFQISIQSFRKALLNHDKTYNRALDFIENPPSDCKIIQLCPPQRLKTKRDSKNISLLKADYELGKKVAEELFK